MRLPTMRMLPHRYSHTNRMITEVNDPYTREYRVECSIKAEKIMEATVSATAATNAPGITGGRGWPNGAENRYSSRINKNTSAMSIRYLDHCQVSTLATRSSSFSSCPTMRKNQ